MGNSRDRGLRNPSVYTLKENGGTNLGTTNLKKETMLRNTEVHN